MKTLIILAGALLLIACSSTQTDRAYQELGRSENFKLNHSMIIGLEKVPKKDVANLEHSTSFLYPFIHIPDDLSEDEKYIFKKVLIDQSKVMLPTQIAFQENSGLEFTYNIYDKNDPRNRSANKHYDYKRSFIELSNAFEMLSKRLDVGNYSHILIMSMGWNNNQAESIYRYHKIVDHLKTAALASGERFHPFIIGFTWPSVWFDISDPFTKKIAHLSSYFNKSNDADEIGFTWANLIVNDYLPQTLSTQNKAPPKVIAIGHSMGARLLSRAIFSKPYLVNPSLDFEIDMYLGLQGAFSARRFGDDTGKIWGLEGSPYRSFAEINTLFVLTTSKGDKANPIAFWSCHVGSSDGLISSGLSCAKDNKNYIVREWRGKGAPILINPTERKIIMVDASSIVCAGCDHDRPETDGHNDVLDQEMGDLIWNFIRQN